MTDRWTLVIHGGAGNDERDRMTPEQEAGVARRARRGARGGVDGAGGGRRRARCGRRRRCRCSRTIRTSTPARGAVFTWDGVTNSTPRSWTGATARGGLGRRQHDHAPPGRARPRGDGGQPARDAVRRGRGRSSRASMGSSRSRPAGSPPPERRRATRRVEGARQVGWFDVDLKYGTVGAVAMDTHGHVAAATSTGGRHRQALGPDRRFADHRRGHLCRRSRLRGLRDRGGRILHPRRRRARNLRARALQGRSAQGRRRTR